MSVASGWVFEAQLGGAVPKPSPPSKAVPAPREALFVAVVMTVLALATRFNQFGNPAISVDEQFYLLVGDRVWHGALPFVDIWSREPIGLFLIYAAARPFSPDGVISYQLAAAACATATACVIERLASRVVRPWPALAAGVAYLICLPLLGGAGGQSPVFCNLLTAFAGLCAIKAAEAPTRERFAALALGAMFLAGLALQVKYAAVFESGAMGLWLVAELWRRSRRDVAVTLRAAATWIGVAAAPTLVIWAAYVLAGQGHAFVQANFVSIFQVREPPGSPAWLNLSQTLIRVAPIAVLGGLGAARLLTAPPVDRIGVLLLAWGGAGVVQVFALGHYFPHYALPALIPLSILAAVAMSSPLTIAGGLGLLTFWAVEITHLPSTAERTASAQRVGALAAVMGPYAERGCVYINDGPPILYLKTRSCLPGPYVFPGHLNDQAESEATQAPAAMQALLAGRPSAILVADRPLAEPRNAVTAAMLDEALAAGYRRKTTLPDVFEGRTQTLYVLKDLR